MHQVDVKPTIAGFKAIVRSTFAVVKAGHKTDIEKKKDFIELAKPGKRFLTLKYMPWNA